MSDQFDQYLSRFRKEISEGGKKKLEEDLASGRISKMEKVNAAKYALSEVNEAVSRNNDPKNIKSKVFNDKFFKIWRDPVWSSVIAAGIIALISFLYMHYLGTKK